MDKKKIIPSSAEIVEEANKSNPKADINKIHSKTFESISSMRRSGEKKMFIAGARHLHKLSETHRKTQPANSGLPSTIDPTSHLSLVTMTTPLFPQGSTICAQCGGKCCIDLYPAYLTAQDIERITRLSGRNRAFFVSEWRFSPYLSLTVTRTRQDRSCVFQDRSTGLCSIYPFRPLDCRLFPLDLAFRDRRPVWVFYDYCPLAKLIDDKAIERASSLIHKAFSQEEVLAFSKLPWPEPVLKQCEQIICPFVYTGNSGGKEQSLSKNPPAQIRQDKERCPRSKRP